MLYQKLSIYATLIGLHHFEWMTESIIPRITFNAMQMEEMILKYMTVLEFAQLFSQKFPIQSLPTIPSSGNFFIYLFTFFVTLL